MTSLMRKRPIFLLVTFYLLLSLNPSVPEAASPLTRVVITFAGFSEKEGVLFITSDQGFFQKYGLDVKLVHVRTGSVGMSAIAGGESHLHVGSATGTTFGAIAGGLDVVFIAGLVNKLAGTFVVNPAIKGPSDLKGRNIGVQSMGGGVWMYTLLAFDHWGLDLKRDKITFRVIGDESVRAQSIATGVIDGSYLGYTFASALERQGFRILADLAKLGIPYQNTGVVARRSFINSSPDIIEKVLRALVEAIGFVKEPTNRDATMKSLAKGLHLPRVQDAAEGYELIKILFDRRIYPSVDGIRNTIRLLGTTSEKIRNLKAEEMVDDRFVKKLEQQGLF